MRSLKKAGPEAVEADGEDTGELVGEAEGVLKPS